jgi:hypothetical protein
MPLPGIHEDVVFWNFNFLNLLSQCNIANIPRNFRNAPGVTLFPWLPRKKIIQGQKSSDDFPLYKVCVELLSVNTLFWLDFQNRNIDLKGLGPSGHFRGKRCSFLHGGLCSKRDTMETMFIYPLLSNYTSRIIFDDLSTELWKCNFGLFWGLTCSDTCIAKWYEPKEAQVTFSYVSSCIIRENREPRVLFQN